MTRDAAVFTQCCRHPQGRGGRRQLERRLGQPMRKNVQAAERINQCERPPVHDTCTSQCASPVACVSPALHAHGSGEAAWNVTSNNLKTMYITCLCVKWRLYNEFNTSIIASATVASLGLGRRLQRSGAGVRFRGARRCIRIQGDDTAATRRAEHHAGHFSCTSRWRRPYTRARTIALERYAA